MAGLAVIVGAGASSDCHDPHGYWSEEYRPPLVPGIFSNRQPFLEILEKYQGAARAAADLRSAISQGTAFEDVLAGFFREKSPHLRRMYWEIPMYLQELFGVISKRFAGEHGTRYDVLVQRIERSGIDPVVYITTNYDRFLDRALRVLYQCDFSKLDHCSNAKWALIKLHGSVDWGRELKNYVAPGTKPYQFDILGDDLTLGEIEYIGGHTNRLFGQRFLYPALSAPVSGKQTFACPMDHVDEMRSRLKHCSNVLVIGFSGLDAHVLQELRQSSLKPARFWIVNGNNSFGNETLVRFQAGAGFPFDDCLTIIYDGGFKTFVDSELNHFLDDCMKPLATWRS